MHLRRLRPEDAAAVLRLEELGMTAPWSAAQVTAELAHTLSEGFGAERDGCLHGFALFRNWADECELLRIVVHPWERRQGIAAGLLHFALAECAALGCEVCFLEVRASNTPALALYAGLGFEQDGLRKNYYDNPVEDALTFHKDLLQIERRSR